MLQFNAMSGCAKLTQLAALIFLCIYVPALLAEDYFAPDFIETRGNLPRDVDISRFSKADGQMAGVVSCRCLSQRKLRRLARHRICQS